jgi:hypothetical protein
MRLIVIAALAIGTPTSLAVAQKPPIKQAGTPAKTPKPPKPKSADSMMVSKFFGARHRSRPR